jgi:glutaredoxin
MYSTLGCHLCELAKEALWPLTVDYSIQLTEIDIAESDDLMDRYGIKIPVMMFEKSNTELNWPFTTDQIEAHLKIEMRS